MQEGPSRAHGWSLIGGTLAGFVTMAMHPSGAQLLADFDRVAPRNAVAHGLSILAIPFLLVGFRAVDARLREASTRWWLDIAGALYLVASLAVLIAAVASGFMAQAAARGILDAGPESVERWTTILRGTSVLNQAFATVYVVFLALAVGAWSVAILRGRAFPRWLGGFGLVVSAALLGILIASRAHLDVHTFGLMVLIQGVWIGGLGVKLLR